MFTVGTSSSRKIYEKFNSALQWVMQSKYSTRGMPLILDDFFIGPSNPEQWHVDLTNFRSFCEHIGVQINKEKKLISPQPPL